MSDDLLLRLRKEGFNKAPESDVRQLWLDKLNSINIHMSSGLNFYAIAHDDELMFSCEAPSPIDAMLLMIEQLYDLAIDKVGERYPEVNQWVGDTLGLLNDYKVFEVLVDRNRFIDLLEAKNLSDLKPFIELCEFT